MGVLGRADGPLVGEIDGTGVGGGNMKGSVGCLVGETVKSFEEKKKSE
jgi:hypothetical protein